jgi:hypothetical protein
MRPPDLGTLNREPWEVELKPRIRFPPVNLHLFIIGLKVKMMGSYPGRRREGHEGFVVCVR